MFPNFLPIVNQVSSLPFISDKPEFACALVGKLHAPCRPSHLITGEVEHSAVLPFSDMLGNSCVYHFKNILNTSVVQAYFHCRIFCKHIVKHKANVSLDFPFLKISSFQFDLLLADGMVSRRVSLVHAHTRFTRMTSIVW